MVEKEREVGKIGKIKRGETWDFFGLGHLVGYLHCRGEYP
mgnify:CR=1 FL=1